MLLTSACAPLSSHNSALGTVGEVTGRVLLCPLTLCLSELMLAADYQDRQQRRAYNDWYWSLPPEERDREDRRQAARMQALGLALIGGGIRPYTPAPRTTPVPPPTLNCTSTSVGSQTWMNCQ